MNEIINCGEMITRVFSNIEAGSLENANKLTTVWKTVVKGIKNTRDEYYGEKIASHSDVVDFKNGQLLIETDHPGWIQVMQLHSKFIIRGLNMKLPDFKVSSLVFRLRGNDSMLFDSYEESLEKVNKRMEEKYTADEKKLNEFYVNGFGINVKSMASDAVIEKKEFIENNVQTTIEHISENRLNKSQKSEYSSKLENSLPPEFLAKLESLKNTVLTNSKE